MKVSIVTVCYNSEEYIRSAIESVLTQDYQDIEYIVIDGDSKDNTLEIIKEYQGAISHIVSEPDNGIYDAMNKGVGLATGDVIGVLNSDDFYPDAKVISKVVDDFEADPCCECVLGNIDFVKQSDLNSPVRLYDTKNFKPWMMRFGLMPAHPASFVKRSAYECIGNYKLGYKIAADFDFLFRALYVSKLPYKKIDTLCVRMRLGGVSTEGVSSFKIITQELLRSIRENGIYSNYLFVTLRVFSKLKQLVKR